MTTINRRRVNQALSALGALLAFPEVQAQTAPKRGGTLVYANCSSNRRGGDASNSKHPYDGGSNGVRSQYCSVSRSG